MDKIYGATKREDGIEMCGRHNWQLFYGFGEDEKGKYNFRGYYKSKPSIEQIKADIIATIDKDTDEKIRNGFKWKDRRVWLSAENQFNYKAAYDVAVQTEGANLPVTFRFGTDEEPDYYTFEELGELRDFTHSFINHITNTVKEGWSEKDGIDWSAYM